MTKILKYTKPIYCTYNYMGALDVCGQNDPRMNNWYLNNYIFWRYGLSEKCLHIVKSGVFGDLPFMYQQCVWKRNIKDYYKSLFKSFLDDDFYVYCTNVDEYYINGTKPYNKYHFPHDILIYGYDMNEQIYYVSTYDKTEHYNNFNISMELFDKAWYSKYNRNNAQEISEGLVKGLKLEGGKNYDVNLNQILCDLKSYVNSNCVEKEYKPAIYGVNVYNYVEDYISRAIKGDFNFQDCRMLKLISEHKTLMLKRLVLLQENHIISSELVEKYKKVYNMSQTARMLQLKYLLTNDNTILTAIRDNICRIANEEFILLNKIK